MVWVNVQARDVLGVEVMYAFHTASMAEARRKVLTLEGPKAEVISITAEPDHVTPKVVSEL